MTSFIGRLLAFASLVVLASAADSGVDLLEKALKPDGTEVKRDNLLGRLRGLLFFYYKGDDETVFRTDGSAIYFSQNDSPFEEKPGLIGKYQEFAEQVKEDNNFFGNLNGRQFIIFKSEKLKNHPTDFILRGDAEVDNYRFVLSLDGNTFSIKDAGNSTSEDKDFANQVISLTNRILRKVFEK